MKLSRIDKTITGYDLLTLATDQKRQLTFLEKEIKQSQKQLEEINYDTRKCNKAKREKLKGKNGYLID